MTLQEQLRKLTTGGPGVTHIASETLFEDCAQKLDDDWKDSQALMKLLADEKHKVAALEARCKQLEDELFKCQLPKELNQELLKSLVSYDPDTGVFTWLTSRQNHMRAGAEAGSGKTWRRRRYIQIGDNKYPAQRLAWMYMTGSFPEKLIDHIDRDALNNRWANLRLATPSENARNRSMGSNNASGIKGVGWNKGASKWAAWIRADGKQKHLGLFESKEDAAAAYAKAALKHYGEFAAIVRNP